MQSQNFHKKAQGASPFILWVSLFFIALIVIYWFIGVLEPFYLENKKGVTDLNNVKDLTFLACNSVYFHAEYNFWSKNGLLNVTNTSICLMTNNFNNCFQTPCNLNSNYTYDLTSIFNIRINYESNSLLFGDNK